MGYDAYVKCNCYRDGKISSRPPFEEFVKEYEEGLWLDLDWDKNKEKHKTFDFWKQNNPCEHDNMKICSEHLANISGMAAFRRIIAELGREKFPVLTEYLLRGNGGHLPIEFAEAMYKELKILNQEVSNEKLIVLVELTTGQRAQCINSKYELPFAFNGNKWVYTISKNGFKVIKRRKIFGMEFCFVMFRSNKFTQKKISDKKYLFTDILTSKTCESTINLYPDKAYDDFFEFELQEVDSRISDEYSYIVQPLLNLTKASIQTGNPIIWA